MVHKKCVTLSQSNIFICYSCTFKFLPFNNDNFCLDDISSSKDQVTNCQSLSSNDNSDIYNCFRNKGMHFIHANARSLFNKMSEFRILAKNSRSAVIGVSETWLDSSHTDSSISIDGYTVIRRDRDGHAGGVCLYIREDIPYRTRLDLCNNDLEDLWVEILLPKSKPIYVCVCYRNEQNKNLLKSLETSISNLRCDCDFLVLGDFNICLINSKSKLCKDYKSFLNLYNCKQLIDSPTRVTEKSSTLLDHIFTINISKISQSGVLCTGFSDHYTTYCTRKSIKDAVGKHKTIRIRSMKNYSQINFLEKLRTVDWSGVMNCQHVNDAWCNFKSLFTGVLDEIVPFKQIRIKTRTEPWMSSNILDLIRKRDKALIIANNNKGNKDLRKQFNFLRNKVQREVKKAKSNYLKDKIEDNKDNPKELWKQFKSLGYSNKSKDKSKVTIKVDNEICSEPNKIAKFMNNYFLKVAKDLVKKLPFVSNIYSTISPLLKQFYNDQNIIPNSFKLHPVSENFINNQLSTLNISKSTGYDDIPARFLKDGASEIREIITYLINLSITTNVFPDEFKCAKVKPLYKKKDRTEVENFRPVSILCIVSKILEKAVYIQFEKYLLDNNILYSHQSGFRKGHSTDSCLIDLFDYIHCSISEGDYVGMVLLDLQKAFDTVDHKVLCEKLKLVGVGCPEWFLSYISNRKQFVTIDDSNSNFGSVTCGVPQGSILGPLLFLIYINDLPISVTCKLLLYADDSALLVRGKDASIIASTLSKNLSSCKNWLVDNKLSLHLGKTEAILFGTKRKLKNVDEFNVKCDDVIIKSVKSVKYLGLMIDENLSGVDIVSNILKKSSGRLKFLYRYADLLNTNSRKILCSALIQCHFDYSSSSWYSGINKTLKKKL